MKNEITRSRGPNGETVYRFTCGACGREIRHEIPAGGFGGTGYAYAEDSSSPICYACAAAADRETMRREGRILAYVDGDASAITTWAGEPLAVIVRTSKGRAGFGGRSFHAWARDEDGAEWYGWNGDGPGCAIRLRRTSSPATNPSGTLAERVARKRTANEEARRGTRRSRIADHLRAVRYFRAERLIRAARRRVSTTDAHGDALARLHGIIDRARTRRADVVRGYPDLPREMIDRLERTTPAARWEKPDGTVRAYWRARGW